MGLFGCSTGGFPTWPDTPSQPVAILASEKGTCRDVHVQSSIKYTHKHAARAATVAQVCQTHAATKLSPRNSTMVRTYNVYVATEVVNSFLDWEKSRGWRIR